MTETPPFVRWTLAFGCALREDSDWTDPEQTERQLRSLRGYSDAVHEGRVFEGICVAAARDAQGAPLGFPATEVLGAYGGETFIHAQCDVCPANGLLGRERSALAGCFGLMPIDATAAQRWEDAIEHARERADFDAHFLPTRPRWYGLWAKSPLAPESLALLTQWLDTHVRALNTAEQEFRSAIARAQQHALALHVQLYPAGGYDERAWQVAAHCRVCKAARTEREHRCAVCGFVGRAEPARQRKLRGSRPYVPLVRFLGERGAAEFVERHAKRGGS